MARTNIKGKTSPNKKKPTSPDDLVKAGKAGKAELSEDELKEVSGGAFDTYSKQKY
jgi:bacteriocin-like protein